MKSEQVIFLCFVLITISLEQSDIIQEKDKIIEQNDTSNQTLIDTISNYTGDALSIVLDFTPYISNFKNLGEAILGIDLVTGKNLTNSERILSLICSFPFGKFLKGGKHFKNGHNFLKASERALAGGKMRNFIKFSKASARAFAKPNVVQKLTKAGILVAKGAKSLSKTIRLRNNVSSY